jgi:hypothetical protein
MFRPRIIQVDIGIDPLIAVFGLLALCAWHSLDASAMVMCSAAFARAHLPAPLGYNRKRHRQLQRVIAASPAYAAPMPLARPLPRAREYDYASV